MCDFNQGFKLCSCQTERIKYREQDQYRKVKGELVKIPNKKNDDIPVVYIWTLFRYRGHEQESFSLGSYIFPREDLGRGLNAEWISLNLNAGDCFDFDYTPEEGDNLMFGTNVILSTYSSFIYRDGEWVLDHYDPFSTKIEYVCNGSIQELE